MRQFYDACGYPRGYEWAKIHYTHYKWPLEKLDETISKMMQSPFKSGAEDFAHIAWKREQA